MTDRLYNRYRADLDENESNQMLNTRDAYIVCSVRL